MAAVIGSIVGELIVDGRQFDRGIALSAQNAERRIGQSFVDIERRHQTMATRIANAQKRLFATAGAGLRSFTGSGVSTLAGATVGALSFTAAINGAREAVAKYDAIGKSAKATGLNAETFQELSYAAKLGGVETEKFAAALETFAKNSGLAVEGKGRMVTQLRALNPELLEAIQNATTMDERVRLAADAIAKAGSASEAAALSATLFGDAGTRMVEVFRGGTAALDDIGRKARELGLVVDENLIARAETLGDELETASTIIDLKMKAAFIDLAPAILTATNYAAEFARLMGIAADSLRSIEDRQYLRPLQNDLAKTYNEMDAVKGQIADLEAQLAGGGNGVGMILRLDLDEAKAKLADLDGQANRLLQRIQTLQGYRPPGATSAPAAAPTPSPNLSGGADLALLDLNLPGEGALERVATRVGKVKAATIDLMAATGAQTAAVAAQATAYDRMADQIAMAQGLAQQFTSGLLNDLLAGRSLTESLSDAFGNLGNRLLNLAADQAISALFAGLSGALGGGFSGPGLGGSYGFGLYAKGGIPPGTGISRYSNKIVHSPTLFPFAKGIGLMGEAGPEAIMPLSRNSRGELGVSMIDGVAKGLEKATPMTVAPTYQIDARGSTLTKADFKALLEANHKRIRRDLPAMLADARKRGSI